jgi:hypothetical protein
VTILGTVAYKLPSRSHACMQHHDSHVLPRLPRQGIRNPSLRFSFREVDAIKQLYSMRLMGTLFGLIIRYILIKELSNMYSLCSKLTIHVLRYTVYSRSYQEIECPIKNLKHTRRVRAGRPLNALSERSPTFTGSFCSQSQLSLGNGTTTCSSTLKIKAFTPSSLALSWHSPGHKENICISAFRCACATPHSISAAYSCGTCRPTSWI